MAYKPMTVSPSSLGYVEKCPRFRSSGEDNAASEDGTLYHGHMEALCQLPREQWDEYVEKTEMSSDMRWLVRASVRELGSLVTEVLDPVKDFRIRKRTSGVFLKTKRLKPGIYTECELDLGGGRHGYIDLMIVPSEGPITIVDWKSSRNDHDYTLQIERYALAVNDLCPMHDAFICCIVAPRLSEECQLRIPVGKPDLGEIRVRVRAIEERADRSANDDTVVGCPSDACAFCHWSGRCKYQGQYVDGAKPLLEGGNAMQLAGKNLDAANTDSQLKAAKATISSVDTFRKLTAPGSVFEGVRLTLLPQTPEERGLRRLVLKTMADIFDAVKKDDAKWIADHPGTVELPGYKIQEQRGKASVPPENEAEMVSAFIAKLGLTDQEVIDCSKLSKTKLVDHLVDFRGMKKTVAKAEVDKIEEPYTVRGASVIKWVANEKARAVKIADDPEL